MPRTESGPPQNLMGGGGGSDSGDGGEGGDDGDGGGSPDHHPFSGKCNCFPTALVEYENVFGKGGKVNAARMSWKVSPQEGTQDWERGIPVTTKRV